jgi:hypothetical protein
MLSMIFHTIKRFFVRFCAFLFLVVSLYAVDIDAAGACVDGAGSVVHADGMAGVGVGPPAVAPPAERCKLNGQ